MVRSWALALSGLGLKPNYELFYRWPYWWPPT